MLVDGTIPLRGGVYIDIYNQIANERICGTIHTRIDRGNYWYVTEVRDGDMDDTDEGQGV